MALDDVVPYGASALNGLLRAQLGFVKTMADDYISAEQMPHERGSVDSWAYMMDAMEIAVQMMDGVSRDAGLDDEGVKRFIRNLVKDKWLRLEGFADEVVEFAGLASYDPETDAG